MESSILLVTNSRDLAVDSIVEGLQLHGEPYLRLDLDLLASDEVSLNPTERTLRYRLSGGQERVIARPKAILYRAPTHLRESSGHRYSSEQLLARHQWAAFARALAVFRDARWVNHPVATYRAESKPYQLVEAHLAGFLVPETVVANCPKGEPFAAEDVAAKALDSFLLRHEESDLFFYTTRLKSASLRAEDCCDMPMIFQEFVAPKVDLRVTVVGTECFAAELERSVEGDWRLLKSDVRFKAVTLPQAVYESCVRLVQELGLVYGAIDLARRGDAYYFFEVNPTGEWAWLDDVFEDAISQALVKTLAFGAS